MCNIRLIYIYWGHSRSNIKGKVRETSVFKLYFCWHLFWNDSVFFSKLLKTSTTQGQLDVICVRYICIVIANTSKRWCFYYSISLRCAIQISFKMTRWSKKLVSCQFKMTTRQRYLDMLIFTNVNFSKKYI